MRDKTAALVNNFGLLAVISAISISIAYFVQSAWGLISVLLMTKWINWEHWGYAEEDEEDDGGEGDEDDAVVHAPKSAPEDRRSMLN